MRGLKISIVDVNVRKMTITSPPMAKFSIPDVEVRIANKTINNRQLKIATATTLFFSYILFNMVIYLL